MADKTPNQLAKDYRTIVDTLAEDLARAWETEDLERVMIFGNILIAKYRSDYVIARAAEREVS